MGRVISREGSSETRSFRSGIVREVKTEVGTTGRDRSGERPVVEIASCYRLSSIPVPIRLRLPPAPLELEFRCERSGMSRSRPPMPSVVLYSPLRAIYCTPVGSVSERRGDERVGLTLTTVPGMRYSMDMPLRINILTLVELISFRTSWSTS